MELSYAQEWYVLIASTVLLILALIVWDQKDN